MGDLEIQELGDHCPNGYKMVNLRVLRLKILPLSDFLAKQSFTQREKGIKTTTFSPKVHLDAPGEPKCTGCTYVGMRPKVVICT
jgi:hypothetical protein